MSMDRDMDRCIEAEQMTSKLEELKAAYEAAYAAWDAADAAEAAAWDAADAAKAAYEAELKKQDGKKNE